MEHYEKGKNVSLVSSSIEEINNEIKELFATSDQEDFEDKVGVIEVKASARLRNLVSVALNQYKRDKGFVLFVGSGTAVGKVVTLGEMVCSHLHITWWSIVHISSLNHRLLRD